MPENPKSGEASVKGTELQLEKSNLPPTLENPGQ
jgi:hypothetical protein